MEHSNNQMANEIRKLKVMIKNMMAGPVQRKQPCDFCCSANYRPAYCPTLHYKESGDVNVVGEYQNFSNNRQ